MSWRNLFLEKSAIILNYLSFCIYKYWCKSVCFCFPTVSRMNQQDGHVVCMCVCIYVCGTLLVNRIAQEG